MYIVGDVHGCFKTLRQMLKKIGEDSVIYSVGDLVDKGPDTCKVLDYVMKLKNFNMVLGNHERHYIENMPKYIKYIKDGDKSIFSTNWYRSSGGKQTIESYRKIENKLEMCKKIEQHIDFLKKSKIYYYFKDKKINGKKMFITHGFALPYFSKRFKVDSDKITTLAFTANRLDSRHFNLGDPKNIKMLNELGVVNIFGHIATEMPLRSSILINVDTSCVYGNKLTCYDYKNNSFISIDNLDEVNYKD